MLSPVKRMFGFCVAAIMLVVSVTAQSPGSTADDGSALAVDYAPRPYDDPDVAPTIPRSLTSGGSGSSRECEYVIVYGGKYPEVISHCVEIQPVCTNLVCLNAVRTA